MDGVVDAADNCRSTANANQANNDGDVKGDVCDSDDDNDTVIDTADNCPIVVGAPSNAGCPAVAIAPPPATTPKKCKKKKKKR